MPSFKPISDAASLQAAAIAGTRSRRARNAALLALPLLALATPAFALDVLPDEKASREACERRFCEIVLDGTSSGPPLACDMTYINTTLNGIACRVQCGNALSTEPRREWLNPFWTDGPILRLQLRLQSHARQIAADEERRREESARAFLAFLDAA